MTVMARPEKFYCEVFGDGGAKPRGLFENKIKALSQKLLQLHLKKGWSKGPAECR